MGVRLNKALKNLNISPQTAIDFLKSHTEIGEIKSEATINTKISDEQYLALLEEFEDAFFVESPYKWDGKSIPNDKIHYEDNPTTIINGQSTIKIVGKIDVNALEEHIYIDEEDYDKAFEEVRKNLDSSKTDHGCFGQSEQTNIMSKDADKGKNTYISIDYEYSEKFLISYEKACQAYNNNWSEWIVKGRNSIEEFCKYYICWLCGKDNVRAKNILLGKCDFENDFSLKERTSPQGRRLITLIYQEHGEQLKKFISDHILYSTYVTLSKFIHNSQSPTVENTKPIQKVLERLYSIYIWTTNKDYSDVKEERPYISLTHSTIKFITSQKGHNYVKISSIDIKKGHEGDYMIIIDGKHNYIVDRDYTNNYDEDSIRSLLKHDWIIMRQKRNKFVEFDFDDKKVIEEIQWGMSQLKTENEKYANEVDVLFEKITFLDKICHRSPNTGVSPSPKDFLNTYYILRRLEPVVPVFIDNNKWLVLLDKITIEDTNFLWGDDARIHIEGLDPKKEYIKKSIDLKISKSKSEIIKSINSHQYNSLDLVKVSNKYHILINYENGNL